MSLINPYLLLGLSPKSSIQELKKAYYQLALLCHPDKGGNTNDMYIVQKAYEYVNKQLLSINNITYDELENDFENFCKNQLKENPPTFYEIHLDIHKKEFDKKYEKHRKKHIFDKGYGDIMDKNDNINLDYNPVELNKPSKKIEKKVIIYEKPESLPNQYGIYHRLDICNIDDFSYYGIKNMTLSDYKKAYSSLDEMKMDDINKVQENKKVNDLINERNLFIHNMMMKNCLFYLNDYLGYIYIPTYKNIKKIIDIKKYITTKRKYYIENIRLFNSNNKEYVNTELLSTITNKYILMSIIPIII